MGRITRRGLAVAAVGTLAGTLTLSQASAQPGPFARRGRGRSGPRASADVRGMWIATLANIDWPAAQGLSPADAQAELTGLLDTAADWGLNTVFLQVRPTADALWPSPFEPWSQWLTGVPGRDPGWDPLDFAVREAHDRGLALHTWFNPYRVATHDDPGKLAEGHPVRDHPGWAVPYGGRLYYNPGLPEVRAFVQDAMMHAVESYEIDGVHWDDYFYPYPVAGEEFDDDAAFREHGGGYEDRGDWRRHNIDLLVREMRDRVRAARPGVPFGVSPFAIWRNRATDPLGSDTDGGVQTYDDLYADVRTWVKEGWLDYVVPQVYWHIGNTAADYATLVRWWSDVAEGTDVALYIGEALYKAGDPAQPEAWQDPAELSRHLTLCRDHAPVGGNVFYSASQVLSDPIGAMSRVFEDHYRG
ncbi:glycoside hydrolase family 10 protein [Streptomyces litchfieldiae]|uniref:Family 10 glycosylhydrolase n=1 Tax=Streptomyces litchfieldiae TaxID=3075543 RepID=A0ABU2MVH2_9ACTN|nr:family 10 glycosylhydrolase [Streptomyces sp. DSM 44938]MDT0345633.1 family 10 glycosylhydrolase [Streptomyces sp. DSM 44938]